MVNTKRNKQLTSRTRSIRHRILKVADVTLENSRGAIHACVGEHLAGGEEEAHVPERYLWMTNSVSSNSWSSISTPIPSCLSISFWFTAPTQNKCPTFTIHFYRNSFSLINVLLPFFMEWTWEDSARPCKCRQCSCWCWHKDQHIHPRFPHQLPRNLSLIHIWRCRRRG